MYSEDDFIQLSALQHFIFCRRQCALIHIEQVWVENLFTAKGRIMHDKAHEERVEIRDGVRIERGIPLRSNELGLNGKADVVEFHKEPGGKKLLPFPVEYKHGKPKADDCDKVQLCAQALCLEEMLGVIIPKGAIFYGRIKHRLEVEFDEELRSTTKETIKQVHDFIKQGKTPLPVYMKKCESCSLISFCMPKLMGKSQPVREYLEQQLREL
ncbi:MAG: CRISPR-associated protein Cas4 [Candidatus Omnitrophica bacterium]|nr:CRISPR-associated protein Cas4 [Candidatus Omnitrophota bacterium]